MISSHYDHDPRHVRFSRTHTGDLERSDAMDGWGSDLLNLGIVAAGVALLWFLGWAFSS
jgi:hypothetical protein